MHRHGFKNTKLQGTKKYSKSYDNLRSPNTPHNTGNQIRHKAVDRLLTKEDGHLASIKSFDNHDLWRSVEDLMMIHGEVLKT